MVKIACRAENCINISISTSLIFWPIGLSNLDKGQPFNQLSLYQTKQTITILARATNIYFYFICKLTDSSQLMNKNRTSSPTMK